jgi:hypothetical protein
MNLTFCLSLREFDYLSFTPCSSYVERAASSSFCLALIMLPVLLLSAFDIGTGILRVGLNGRNRSLVGVYKHSGVSFCLLFHY